MNDKEKVLEKLKNVPKQPGVYLWKDQNQQIIYVGKGKNLFNRMHQYFKGSINSFKTSKMVEQIVDFDFFVCNNEQEALILEKNYIEIHKPQYNIQLLDDKRYPYICLKLTNKLSITREFRINKRDVNTFYYGPFTKGSLARTMTDILQRLFLFENGILIENDSYENWKNKFTQIVELLKLKDKTFEKLLETKMYQAAETLNFELAKEYKDALNLISMMRENQIAELSNSKNIDVFSVIITEQFVWIYAVLYRYGVQISHEKITLENFGLVEEVLTKFFEQFYKTIEKPEKILISHDFKDLHLDINFQNKFIYPEKGVYHQILERANKNNNITKNTFETENIMKQTKNELLKNEINSIFSLSTSVRNIFLFDNSNLNNNFVVGAVVAYQNLKKNKSLYKKFNHSNLSDNFTRKSDVEYMYLTVARFLNSFKNELSENDVFIVDGGKQQIAEAIYALKEANLPFTIPVYGLIKDDFHRTKQLIDEKYNQISVSKDLFNFLSQMQIEVDRFAKSFMRKKHLANSFESKLTQIKGIGAKTEQKLLSHFKTYNNIYNASFEEIEKITNKKVAKILVDELGNKD
ncbi:excinuclease ABC subunit UvrC [Mycoplasma buteonis]|uniref:excinuclease ABC subunit UvrC n=1 Tax=Mycoplasma buteonis TaxID=171280 RepID=UPI000567F84A|nr:excinuclease ABC subunit UvrC [Mycoplasma buteonis]